MSDPRQATGGFPDRGSLMLAVLHVEAETIEAVARLLGWT